MKRKNKIILSIILAFLFFSLQTHIANENYTQVPGDKSVENLEKGFINPPLYARLRVYWGWLNSMATKESITRISH
ncbi:MAG: hypothetical protein KAU83_09720 [Bacteroidales bacterium]|nr:hypothetical protein [Bacteroidales bacterium]